MRPGPGRRSRGKVTNKAHLIGSRRLILLLGFQYFGTVVEATSVMSELRYGANVELADFFRLAAPLIVQMDEVAAVVHQPVADGRRPAAERRAHRRTTATDRPAGSGARRNERERNRVRQVNAGFDRLRDHVPQGRRNRKLSKVDTLRAAVEYIGHLQEILGHRTDGSTPPPTFDIGDENYLDHASTGSIDDDVIDSWYVDPQFCENLERAPAEASMMQLLVSPEDITRALGGGSSSASSAVDHRLTVDVHCSTTPPPDGLSFAGSASCGGCATPESVDPEVTSSSGSGQLDEDTDQLFDFESWLT